jgi:hypothetical protein
VSNRTVDFSVVDADNHLYETEDAFTRYLPEKHAGAIKYVQVEGRTKIAIRGTISEYIPNPTFEVVAAPGAHEELYRHGNPEGKSLRELTGKPIRCPDWAREPKSRLAKLDELGIDAALMFPTLASLLEERMRDDPDLTHDAVHAFNQWLHDEWTFNHEDRIFATPVITLPIVERAIEELEWCLERGRGPCSSGPHRPGACAVLARRACRSSTRSGPASRRPASWWRCTPPTPATPTSPASGRARASSCPSSSTRCGPWSRAPGRSWTPWRRWSATARSRRFPDLRVATVENGGSWVRPLLKNFEGTYKKMPMEFAEHPIEAFNRNVYVNPFWEDGLPELIDAIGAERILFGSDFPHPEGLADPVSFVDELPSSLARDDVERIMGGNLAGLLKIAA